MGGMAKRTRSQRVLLVREYKKEMKKKNMLKVSKEEDENSYNSSLPKISKQEMHDLIDTKTTKVQR